MKPLLLFLGSLSLSLTLAACKSSCDGTLKCGKYGQVTDCVTNSSGHTHCTTREECVDYFCCGGHSCNGIGCGDVCFKHGFAVQGVQPSKLNLKDLSLDRVMSAAANADLTYMNRAGLQLEDMLALADSKALSEQSTQRVARTLGESSELVERVTADISAAFQKERADLQSTYWQTCMSTERWQTDRNPYCRSTSWPGCSPEKGASLCISEAGTQRLKSLQ